MLIHLSFIIFIINIVNINNTDLHPSTHLSHYFTLEGPGSRILRPTASSNRASLQTLATTSNPPEQTTVYLSARVASLSLARDGSAASGTGVVSSSHFFFV